MEGDDDLAVCTDLDSENWEENFMDELGNEQPEERESSDEFDGESDMPNQQPLKVKTYSEAMDSLENVMHFLENQGNTEECFLLGNLVDRIASAKLSKLKQTTISDYLN